MNDLKKMWLAYAVVGLLLLGAGLSFFGEALLLKWDNAPFLEWFLWGTFALIVFNAGISLFGQAVIYRLKLENQQKP